MKKFHAMAVALLCAASTFAGCSEEPTRGSSESNLTQAGSCVDACGGRSKDGCWCDSECAAFGDCCTGNSGKALVCDGCSDGAIEVTNSFGASSDDKECASETQHCVTNDGGSCPQLSPLPPDYCPNGTVVKGPKSHIPSADGMECSLPSAHCVTDDAMACPLRSPLNPNFCSDGEIVKGDSTFIPSTDGMECEIPSVHCVTTNANACDASCSNGELEFEDVFSSAGNGLSCVEEVSHCITSDGGSCPQFSPLPPNYCPDGTAVSGPPSYISSADGMECKMPSVHCVTNDMSACPLRSPLPPDYCEGGEVRQGPDSFIQSTDGMECLIPSVHCVQEAACGS